MKAKVLNGEVEKGDRVAYATRGGSSLDMNIGTVLDIYEKPHPWKTGVVIPILKVEVTESTDIYTLPRHTTLGVLDRVVKL